MPSKHTPKAAAASPPEAQATQRLPSLDDISSQLLAGATEAPDQPPPPLFEPATDDPDDDQDEDEEGTTPPTPPPTASASAPQPDLGAMMQSFMEIMAEREERLMARVEARLAAVRPPEQQTANISPAELAAPPGQYPPVYTNSLAQQAAEATARVEQQAVAARPTPRMVAFIPREDPQNPRQTTFKTWLNGREIRAKRGQVMLLSLGHGIDLARNGHGNCVDIAAMQGIGVAEPLKIPQMPNLARPANWDGLPMSAQSSIPVMNGIA